MIITMIKIKMMKKSLLVSLSSTGRLILSVALHKLHSRGCKWKHDKDDDEKDDVNDDGNYHGYPAYCHQSYSHQVGICHNDEGWEHS